MHDSEDSAGCATTVQTIPSAADSELLDVLDAVYSLEIQKYRLLIARERRQLTMPAAAEPGDYLIRHRPAA